MAKRYVRILHEVEANQYIEQRNLQDKYISYKCPVCGKFHIGHRNRN